MLISPIAIGHPNRMEKVLPVSITKEQVKNSPDLDTDKPVSRQRSVQYCGYYGYPHYWSESSDERWSNSLTARQRLSGVDNYCRLTRMMVVLCN